jgi:dephospho-CoA kinase
MGLRLNRKFAPYYNRVNVTGVNPMLVIGVAGGIASGKSLVSKQLQQLGAEVLDADRAGHEVLLEPDVERALRSHWGDDVFGDDRRISRAAVAKIVFAAPPEGPKELAYLEQITHPRIEERLRRRKAEFEQRGDLKAVVLDAALMFEAGWNKLCDKIVFVETPRESRVARARQRGWSEAEFAAREAAQESLEVKRKSADWIIDNSGSPEHTFAQLQRFWLSLD